MTPSAGAPVLQEADLYDEDLYDEDDGEYASSSDEDEPDAGGDTTPSASNTSATSPSSIVASPSSYARGAASLRSLYIGTSVSCSNTCLAAAHSRSSTDCGKMLPVSLAGHWGVTRVSYSCCSSVWPQDVRSMSKYESSLGVPWLREQTPIYVSLRRCTPPTWRAKRA